MAPLEPSSADSPDPDVYPWMAAPPHLKTRRQLRAAGLRPNGHEPVARMIRRRYGRDLVAYLYDTRLAAPKRTASPSQLIAIAKAVREHQTRAAGRRGLTHADLTAEVDPGPQWTGNHPSHNHSQGETRMNMSDPQNLDRLRAGERQIRETIQRGRDEELALATHVAALPRDQWPQAAEEIAAARAEVDRLDAEPLDVQLGRIQDEARADLAAGDISAAHAEEITNIAATDEPALIVAHVSELAAAGLVAEVKALRLHAAVFGPPTPNRPEHVPVGAGQRRAYLHATIAVNHARDERERLLVEMEAAERNGGGDLLEEYVEQRLDEVETRLADPPRNDHDRVLHLADALAWQVGSALAERRVQELTTYYTAQWGVLVDVENDRVSVDPEFDAATAQARAEARALWNRGSAVIDIVSAAPLSAAARSGVSAAIHAWRGTDAEPADPRAYLDAEPERRTQLGEALDKVAMPESDRNRLDFTIDYLRGDVSGLDLLDSPVLVDPGEEARGRVDALLMRWHGGTMTGADMAEEISVMTADDQQHVRTAARAMRGTDAEAAALWPDYTNRLDAHDEIRDYARSIAIEVEEIDWVLLAEYPSQDPRTLGVDDNAWERVEAMATQREQLRDLPGQGVVSIERHQWDATLADLDAGRITHHYDLPELMFADERSKAGCDDDRHGRAVYGQLTPHVRALTAVVDTTVDYTTEEGQGVEEPLQATHFALIQVATVGQDRKTDRENFLDARGRLGQALSAAGVDDQTKPTVREAIDTAAGVAADLGKVAIERRSQWSQRTDQIIAQRDDAIARRAAANAANTPARSGRHRGAHREHSAATTEHAPAAPSRLRALHNPEHGR